MVDKPLIRPYYWGGTFGGGWLTSHNYETRRLESRKYQKKTSSPGKIEVQQHKINIYVFNRVGLKSWLKMLRNNKL